MYCVLLRVYIVPYVYTGHLKMLANYCTRMINLRLLIKCICAQSVSATLSAPLKLK